LRPVDLRAAVFRRPVAFLRVALARVVTFLPLVVDFLAEDRALRVGFFAAPRAPVDAFFPGVRAGFTTLVVASSVAVPTDSPAGSATRSTGSHVRSGGDSGEGAGGGAGAAGVSGAPPHGELYPSLLGSSTSYMATSFPCFRSMLLRFGRGVPRRNVVQRRVGSTLELAKRASRSAPVVGVDDEPGDDRVRQRRDEEGPVRVEGVGKRHHGEAEQEQDHDRSETSAFGHVLILERRPSFAPCADRDRIRACTTKRLLPPREGVEGWRTRT